MSYVIVGKVSEVNIDEVINNINELLNKGNGKEILSKKQLQKIISIAFGAVVYLALSDYVGAASLVNPYQPSAKLDSIFQFIEFLINTAKWIFSGVIGAIFTYAGWKWSTDLSGAGQTEAKKIMKNCIIGGLLIWSGATIGNVFVNKLEAILK